MRGIRPACRAKAVSTCAFPVELVTRADAEPLPEIETATCIVTAPRPPPGTRVRFICAATRPPTRLVQLSICALLAPVLARA